MHKCAVLQEKKLFIYRQTCSKIHLKLQLKIHFSITSTFSVGFNTVNVGLFKTIFDVEKLNVLFSNQMLLNINLHLDDNNI